MIGSVVLLILWILDKRQYRGGKTMKNRSLITSVIIILQLLFIIFNCGNKPILASDQKLAHGAGTLPHLTSAITLELGAQIPMPALYSLRYDIGLGNRVQLGLSTCFFPSSEEDSYFSVEIHSMFNVLKNSRESDFFSLYLNPSIINMRSSPDFFNPSYTDYHLLLLNPGIAYEHRFGSKRRNGLYAKAGVIGVIDYKDRRLKEGFEDYLFDCRIGYQTLLGNLFSITLEPGLIVFSEPDWLFGLPIGKVALTWAF
jgi:hypothetical protein